MDPFPELRLVTPREVEEPLAFARRAAQWFLENPLQSMYTDGDIVSGCWFAVRWGAEPEKAHAVLVLKVDEVVEPVIYGDLEYDRARRAAT